MNGGYENVDDETPVPDRDRRFPCRSQPAATVSGANRRVQSPGSSEMP